MWKDHTSIKIHSAILGLILLLSIILFLLYKIWSFIDRKILHITEMKNRISEMENEIRNLEKYKTFHYQRTDSLKKILSSNLVAFPFLAGIISDYMTYDIELIAQNLKYNRKNLEKASTIREIRAEAKARIEESRIAYYQLEYLKQIFPELENFLNADYSEVSQTRIEDFLDHDPIRDYITNDEWMTLSNTERNQLALDRYIQSHSKSKWQIGRDYELYVGYKYFRQGFAVDYFGSYQKLEDLGRDLIVKRGDKTNIVQCKYWSKNKVIHEKHIAQLYGTTISYCIEQNLPIDSVHAVFITNITLSDTAKKMADILHVAYKENYEIQEFPRIKCNIGRDEFGLKTKIYHLPMDQQYDKVKIVKKEEFFAFTVAEAEAAGFRRAYKWHPSSF